MGYPLRHVPEDGVLVEITINTIQGRYLLRPDRRGRVNELLLGVLGRAQRLTSISIVGISVLSSHALCAAAHKACYVERLVMWSGEPRLKTGAIIGGGFCT